MVETKGTQSHTLSLPLQGGSPPCCVVLARAALRQVRPLDRIQAQIQQERWGGPGQLLQKRLLWLTGWERRLRPSLPLKSLSTHST